MYKVEKHMVEEAIRQKEIKELRQYVVNIESIESFWCHTEHENREHGRGHIGLSIIDSTYIKNHLLQLYHESVKVPLLEFNILKGCFSQEAIGYITFSLYSSDVYVTRYCEFIKRNTIYNEIKSYCDIVDNNDFMLTKKFFIDRIHELTLKINKEMVGEIVLKQLRQNDMFDELWLNHILKTYIL